MQVIEIITKSAWSIIRLELYVMESSKKDRLEQMQADEYEEQNSTCQIAPCPISKM